MDLTSLAKKEWVWLIVLAILFLGLRLPAIHSPYHQDEYKWPMYADPQFFQPGAVVHPPLAELVYRKMGPLVGYDNFRFIPLLFSFINLFLLFYLAKSVFSDWGDKESGRSALWAAFIFSVSFFSVLASLMVDVDGAVMPFFFLIFSIAYFQLRKKDFKVDILSYRDREWLALLLIGAIGGFMVKVSGVLPIIAFFVDFLWQKKVFSDKKSILKYLGFGLAGAAGLVVLLLVAKLVFPFFPLEKSIVYWKHFANSSSFFGRGWLQTFIQFAKSMLYASPLLVLTAFFADREIFKKARPFFLFIFVGLAFYLFVFDFSLGALDRYMQFLVVPLSIIAGGVLAKASSTYEPGTKKILGGIAILATLILCVQFFTHFVPPLYPKTEWLSRMLSFKWNFLYPFSGGSGPLPFYVSFLFLALVWICAVIFAIAYVRLGRAKGAILLSIVALSLAYNLVFIEEYSFGKINGSAATLVRQSSEFVKSHPEVKNVIVYNDNGGWDIRESGKYLRRMYATPQFEEEYKKVLSDFSGHILFIDIPKIQNDSFYGEYLNSCKEIYSENDRYILAKVLDCRK